MTDFLSACTGFLRVEEGVRHSAYKDSRGFWTNGVGRLLEPSMGGGYSQVEQEELIRNDHTRASKPIIQWVLTDPEVNMLLANDIAKAVTAMQNWLSWEKAQGNTARMVAMTSMCFQLGPKGWAAFHNSLALIAQGDFDNAADQMLQSAWARQTPNRAKAVTELIRTGELT
jgi:lysozyme